MSVSEDSNKFYDYDMFETEYLISYPKTPTIPNFLENIIQATRELAGNPSDPRRTRSQFESSLSIKDPWFD